MLCVAELHCGLYCVGLWHGAACAAIRFLPRALATPHADACPLHHLAPTVGLCAALHAPHMPHTAAALLQHCSATPAHHHLPGCTARSTQWSSSLIASITCTAPVAHVAWSPHTWELALVLRDGRLLAAELQGCCSLAQARADLRRRPAEGAWCCVALPGAVRLRARELGCSRQHVSGLPVKHGIVYVLSTSPASMHQTGDLTHTHPLGPAGMAQDDAARALLARPPTRHIPPSELQQVLGAHEVPAFDLVKGRLVCEYTSHPRTLLYCCGQRLLRVDLRGVPHKCDVAPAKASVTLLQALPEDQHFTALVTVVAANRAAQQAVGFMCAAATSSHVLLLDSRTPDRLLLMWRHGMAAEVPSVIAMQLALADPLPRAGAASQHTQLTQHTQHMQQTQQGAWYSQQHESWLSQQPSQRAGPASQQQPGSRAREGPVQLPRCRGFIALGNLGQGELQYVEFEVSAPLGVQVVPADERREQRFGEMRWKPAAGAGGGPAALGSMPGTGASGAAAAGRL